MTPLDDDPLNEPRYPVGTIVRTLWSEAEWVVTGHADGKEGEGAVCVVTPVLGPEREVRLGYGALRPAKGAG